MDSKDTRVPATSVGQKAVAKQPVDISKKVKSQKEEKAIDGASGGETSQTEVNFQEALIAQMSKEKVDVPSVEEMFACGLQFGHETRRWDPRMEDFIFVSKESIHVLDLNKTKEKLEEAAKFLKAVARRGSILFVGTKRQASKIVREEAIRSGSYFIDNRWVGGLLSNFTMTSKSFKKLREMEELFEKGVEGRTKYEISQMKKEWERLNKLYSGIKSIDKKPSAIVVVDAKFEKGAVREARSLGIPIVAIVDTNTNPQDIDYVIPANDDAISSIRLIIKTLANAINAGNGGKGVTHNLKDFSKTEISIIKGSSDAREESGRAEVAVESGESTIKRFKRVDVRQPAAKKASNAGTQAKGILERVQKEKEEKIQN